MGMTPLVEIIQKDFDPPKQGKKQGNAISVDQVLSSKATQLCKHWGRTPFFVDLWLLNQNLRSSRGVHPLTQLAEEGRTRQLLLIPVTGLRMNSDYQAAAASVISVDRRGACIRIQPNEVESPSFQSTLNHLLSYLKLSPEEADLLIDYQILRSDSPRIANLCTRIPHLQRWRTFIMASGAFPKDLSALEKNRQHTLQRLDWLTWRNEISTESILPRKPCYSDYSIQHPIFSEPPEFSNFSASIRYTSKEYWVIMRGEGVHNEGGPGYAQWPANAELLRGRPEFCGANFSYGYKYIHEMSLQSLKPGSAETWIRAGINHHLTFVVRQIASQYDLSIVDTPSYEVNKKKPLQQAVYKSRHVA